MSYEDWWQPLLAGICRLALPSRAQSGDLWRSDMIVNEGNPHSGFACTSDTTDFRGGIWGFVPPAATDDAPFTAAPAIQIRWADSDFSLLETHPLTPGLLLAGMAYTSTAGPTTTGAGGVSPSLSPSASPTGRFTTMPSRPTTASDTLISPSSNPGQSTASGQPGPSPTSPTEPNPTAGGSPTSDSAMANPAAIIAVITLFSVLVTIFIAVIVFVVIRRKRRGQPLFSLSDWYPFSAKRARDRRHWGIQTGSRGTIFDTELARDEKSGRESELDSPPKTAVIPPPDEPNSYSNAQTTASAPPAVAPWLWRLSRVLSPRLVRSTVGSTRPQSWRTHVTVTPSEGADSSEWDGQAPGSDEAHGGLTVPGRPHLRESPVRSSFTASSAGSLRGEGEGAGGGDESRRMSRGALTLPRLSGSARLSGGTFGGGRLGASSPRRFSGVSIL